MNLQGRHSPLYGYTQAVTISSFSKGLLSWPESVNHGFCNICFMCVCSPGSRESDKALAKGFRNCAQDVLFVLTLLSTQMSWCYSQCLELSGCIFCWFVEHLKRNFLLLFPPLKNILIRGDPNQKPLKATIHKPL